MYSWALKPFGRLGWLAAFLFVVCGALRLARFNVQVTTVESKRFVGLPIPAAASMVSATVLLFYHFGWPSSYKKLAIIILIYFLAFLMVSNVKYYSFKDPGIIKRQPFAFLVLAILLLTHYCRRTGGDALCPLCLLHRLRAGRVRHDAIPGAGVWKRRCTRGMKHTFPQRGNSLDPVPTSRFGFDVGKQFLIIQNLLEFKRKFLDSGQGIYL